METGLEHIATVLFSPDGGSQASSVTNTETLYLPGAEKEKTATLEVIRLKDEYSLKANLKKTDYILPEGGRHTPDMGPLISSLQLYCPDNIIRRQCAPPLYVVYKEIRQGWSGGGVLYLQFILMVCMSVREMPEFLCQAKTVLYMFWRYKVFCYFYATV